AAVWTLVYSQMSWDRWAKYRLSCRLWDCLESEQHQLSCSVDVEQNMLDLLGDVQKAAGPDRCQAPLYLRNPNLEYDQERGWKYAGRYVLSVVGPEFLSGPVVNVLTHWDFYKCGKYSDRLGDWLWQRRFKAPLEELARMNGIEIERYQFGISEIALSHHAAGIRPSGVPALGAPRFIDPWWRQDWEKEAFLHPDGLYTVTTEATLCAGVVAYLALVGVLALKLGRLLAGPVASPGEPEPGLWAFLRDRMTLAHVTAGLSTGVGGAVRTFLWGLDHQPENLLSPGGRYIHQRETGDWKAWLVDSLKPPGPGDPYDTFPEAKP
ncbi:MAG: hypothetical protein KC910_35970, partial [Candidatus Eremiobacteraeota bacterium]|nr:hypothetical protein [Candidatus Eremiobacteraeota bacterium]